MSPINLPIDRLSCPLERFRMRAHLFHAGPLCGVTHFSAEPGRGFLHVLRRGEMDVTHRARDGVPRRIRLREPSLLLYPRPVVHDFHTPPDDGSDLTCAAIDFDGGERNPLVRALPSLILVALSRVEGLEQSLDLLFAETERVRCGQRLLADKLFEVVLIQLLRWLIDHPQENGIQPGVFTGLAEPRLARALVAMHESPGQPWSLEAMARCAGMSRSAFAILFKTVVGQTPADYLADWRMSLAQSRLREGHSIKTIAPELGYANPSALSRLFSAKLGMSPREWLKTTAPPAAAEHRA